MYVLVKCLKNVKVYNVWMKIIDGGCEVYDNFIFQCITFGLQIQLS